MFKIYIKPQQNSTIFYNSHPINPICPGRFSSSKIRGEGPPYQISVKNDTDLKIGIHIDKLNVKLTYQRIFKNLHYFLLKSSSFDLTDFLVNIDKKTRVGKIKSQRKPKELFQLLFDLPEANTMLFNVSSRLIFFEKL